MPTVDGRPDGAQHKRTASDEASTAVVQLVLFDATPRERVKRARTRRPPAPVTLELALGPLVRRPRPKPGPKYDRFVATYENLAADGLRASG